MAETPRAASYGEYLKLPELLGLQQPLSEAHDELQFIVVHQAFELWFKLAIFELEHTRDAMLRGDLVQAQHYLLRIRAIVRLLTETFEVIETMRPHDFLQFRALLDPASGFQSFQFRELEYLSGLKQPAYTKMFQGEHLERLEKRLKEPTLWDAYVAALHQRGMPTASDTEIVSSVIQILETPDQHALATLTESLIDYDERFSMWRARHVRMTMRMIGSRPGTGRASVEQLVENPGDRMGAGGVAYLETTLQKLFFPLLWEARTFVKR